MHETKLVDYEVDRLAKVDQRYTHEADEASSGVKLRCSER